MQHRENPPDPTSRWAPCPAPPISRTQQPSRAAIASTGPTAPSEALPPPSATDPAWGRSDWTLTSKLSAPPGAHYGRLRRPPGSTPTSRFARLGHDAPVTPIAAGHRAGEGLPSSRRHHRYVPRPLRRGVLHGCAPGSTPLPWPSPRQCGLGTPSPRRTEVDGRHFTRPQASLHATDRIVAPPLRCNYRDQARSGHRGR